MWVIHLATLLLFLNFSTVQSRQDEVKFLKFYFPQRESRDQMKNVEGLKVICHGLNASSNTYWYEPMIKEFKKKNFPVIAVDWKDLADDGYLDAVVAASNVAEELAKELITVKDEYGIDFSRMHIIGHSLGAHIAGYTGKSIFNSTTEKIGRITGLDPAGPGFYSLLSSDRLSKNDALFVDVIHTDTDLLGINLSIGHADFYPNGGALQKGCVIDVGCSHRLAADYFIESITSNNFIAKKCSSYALYVWGFCNSGEEAIMGFGCNPKTRGEYYVTTNSEPPYGKGT